MNDSLSPDTRADAETEGRIDAWEAEGGAAANATPARSNHAATAEAALLQLLGAALVGEWNNLPMFLRRAVYARAVGDGSSRGRSTRRRQLARFLHDRQGP